MTWPGEQPAAPAPPRPLRRRLTWPVVVGVAAGVLYGMAFYRFSEALGGVMILSLLTAVPLAIGLLIGALTPRPAQGGSYGQATGSALLSLGLFLACTIAVLWEGFLCVAFATPLAVGFTVGGATLGYLIRSAAGRTSLVLLGAALPGLLIPLEQRSAVATFYQSTASSIVIHAPASAVWQQIQSVPTIGAGEYQPFWAHRLGLPRPLAATLDHPGVGGVRVATFVGGLKFDERVTVWEPGQRLAFLIKALDKGTLDPHVQVGGQYFDVLSGEYRIEALPGGDTLLHLTSTQRISAHNGGYVGFWVDQIMGGLQGAILQVIQSRAEGSI
jgi:hypothetical protein